MGHLQTYLCCTQTMGKPRQIMAEEMCAVHGTVCTHSGRVDCLPGRAALHFPAASKLRNSLNLLSMKLSSGCFRKTWLTIQNCLSYDSTFRENFGSCKKTIWYVKEKCKLETHFNENDLLCVSCARHSLLCTDVSWGFGPMGEFGFDLFKILGWLRIMQFT